MKPLHLVIFALVLAAPQVGCRTAKVVEPAWGIAQPDRPAYDYRRAIAPASLAFVSGASWGLNQTLAHHNHRFFRAFPNASPRYWGPDSWKNKYWQFDPDQGRNSTPIWFTDGQHLTATINQTLLFGAGITITLHDRRPLWHYALDIGITSAAYTLGNATTYNLIFHK